MKLISTFPLTVEQTSLITELGVEVEQITAAQLVNHDVSEYEIVVFGQVYEPLDFTKFTNLKVLQLGSMGFDMIPLEMLTARDVKIYNNRNGFTIPTSEMVVTYILMLYKKMHQLFEQQQAHQFEQIFTLRELTGQHVTIVGTGHIGTAIAKRLQAFDCEITGVNRSGTMRHYFDQCIRMDEIEAVLTKTDILILALPGNEQTQNWLSAKRIALLQREAIVVNIGRGSLVDEQALIQALQSQAIAGAALDVFRQEPLPDESPLWELANVIITPHNAFASSRNQERMFANIYETVEAYMKGQPLATINGK
ncbi:MAG: NAD(P)-dependent oxidoreductase [Culicoidibacterales bacterium]